MYWHTRMYRKGCQLRLAILQRWRPLLGYKDQHIFLGQVWTAQTLDYAWPFSTSPMWNWKQTTLFLNSVRTTHLIVYLGSLWRSESFRSCSFNTSQFHGRQASICILLQSSFFLYHLQELLRSCSKKRYEGLQWFSFGVVYIPWDCTFLVSSGLLSPLIYREIALCCFPSFHRNSNVPSSGSFAASGFMKFTPRYTRQIWSQL